jgi:hypothetical protein
MSKRLANPLVDQVNHLAGSHTTHPAAFRPVDVRFISLVIYPASVLGIDPEHALPIPGANIIPLSIKQIRAIKRETIFNEK